jgi:hypothetical protein
MFFQTLPVSLLPQIAETLTVSLEKLIGKKDMQPAKRGPAPKLQQQIAHPRHPRPGRPARAPGCPTRRSLNRSQIVTGSQKHRDPRFPPYVFTEHGAIMAPTSARLSGRLHASGGVRFGLPYGIEDTMIDEAEAQGSGGEMGAI